MISLGLWLNPAGENVVRIWAARRGVWDLREHVFSEDTFYYLGGAVERFYGSLLNPREFAYKRDSDMPPGTWQARVVTSRIRILFPEDDETWYTFSRTSVRMSQRVYVNGVWMMDVGRPAYTAEEYVPEQARISFTAQPVNGVIEIVQQSSNFVSYLVWHDNWFVTPGGRGETPQTNLIYLSVIMAGGFLALSLIYVMLFFMLNMRRTNLFFALFSLTWAARLWTSASGQLSPGTGALFGLSWYAEFRIEYISIPITAALIAAIINSLFPGILHRLFRYILYAASATIVVMFIFASPRFMNMTALGPVMWFYGLAVIYIITRFVWKLRKINLPQGVFLSGCGVFLYFILAEFLERLDLFFMPFYTGWGMANFIAPVFALCMGAAVFMAARAEVDMTKEAERQLAVKVESLNQVSQLKTELMETISHEAQGPLGALSNYAKLVALEIRENGPTEQITADLDQIEHEAKRVARLIDTLNEATAQKKSEDTRTAFDMGELIRQAVSLYRPMFKSKGVKLDADARDGTEVFGNPDEVTQVLSNLLQNANNHTDSGVVAVNAYRTERNGRPVVAVTVKDTGRGIAPERLPYIFYRGESDTPGGKGIGLSICKKIIRSHGGEITIESTLGEGTSAIFTLPVKDD